MAGYEKVPTEDSAVSSFMPPRSMHCDIDVAAASPRIPNEFLYIIFVVENPASDRTISAYLSRTMIASHVEKAQGRRLLHRVVRGTRNEVLVTMQNAPSPDFADALHTDMCRRYRELVGSQPTKDAHAGLLASFTRAVVDVLFVVIATGYCTSSPYLYACCMPLNEALASKEKDVADRAKVMSALYTLGSTAN